MNAEEFEVLYLDLLGRREHLQWENYVDHAKHGKCQGNAVGDGKRRNRFDQRANVANDQQQSQHKKQMIDSKQDVLDPHQGIGRGYLPNAGRRLGDKRDLGGV